MQCYLWDFDRVFHPKIVVWHWFFKRSWTNEKLIERPDPLPDWPCPLITKHLPSHFDLPKPTEYPCHWLVTVKQRRLNFCPLSFRKMTGSGLIKIRIRRRVLVFSASPKKPRTNLRFCRIWHQRTKIRRSFLFQWYQNYDRKIKILGEQLAELIMANTPFRPWFERPEV